ncbi:primosomal protein DnaI [Streptococcus sp. DD12]|uniref:primosomal protein DnaI n=1 Tax=Streptococcus sp. DD12 TaxID=1777880 RepID=UPI00079B3013|nr:primosomal protein DnaI [Streptococcus sp. DD12]KXT75218.1 Helicase loader DnaI [Streptococcus sp. DD12]
MESIGQAMAKSGRLMRGDSQAIEAQILADPDVANFISQEGLSQAQIVQGLPKFNQFRLERDKYLQRKDDYVAKGYEPVLVMNEGFVDVTYKETAALKEAQAKRAVSDRIELVSMPRSYKDLHLEDISLDDISRGRIYEAIVDFLDNFQAVGSKGLYLYGDMGVGKSYMLAAMAHELSERLQVATTLLHFPSFVIDVRNAIASGSVKEEIDRVKSVQVLIIDDIGAEQASSWMRDEVLQVILQHRMLEELPTFFTSNYNLTELERHFAQGKKGDETWQAQRVLERVRFLAHPMHLEGANRRNEKKP